MRKCPRAGIAWLVSRDDRVYALPTTCKTKGCVVCRHKVKAKFSMLVEYGCLTLGVSYFTTLTLRAGPGLQKDALYVRACWRQMLEWLRSQYQTVEWVKVVELTKKNQPHLHLVIHLGKSSLVAACESRAKYNARWLAKQCDCLEHRFSSAWRRITGDSYVVDVKEILSAKDVAAYLGKYMAKGILYKEELERLGFKRAWARSGGWPFDQLRLVDTAKGWKHRAFTKTDQVVQLLGNSGSAKEWLQWTEDSPPVREGTDLMFALQQERERLAKLVLDPQLRRMLI